MNIGVRGLLLAVAVILFLLAGIGVTPGTINFVSIGLACFAAAFLVGGGTNA